MPMPEQYYDSPLTGQQLDAAFKKMQGIEQTASRVQSNASAAAQSASQASSSASAASSSATRAGQSATQAQNSASAASSSASAAAESARQAADSAASIEGDADAAAQSASNAQGHATAAQGSASAAAASASAAKDSEDAAETSAGTAQSASAAAAQSERNAKTSETNAASSASAAQQAAGLIEDNLAAIQAAPSNAQTAQNAAAQAAQSASDAEDAAARAEQIADFNPADFATAAQGEKADTAVQSVNGKSGTAVTLAPSDIGAATAAQGSKADTAVQPAALDGYAKTSDLPAKLPNPQALTIQLGSSGSPTTYDGSTPQALTVTPEAVGVAPQPLTGNLDDVTPAQVREAIQAGRQVSLLKDDNILSAWVDTGLNVQCLYGWNIGSYTGRARAISLDGYYGDPNGDNTWNVEKLYGNVLPEVTTAQNGKTVIVQNGQWQLGEASAGGGGEYTLIANTGLTSMNQGTSYNSAAAAQYDLLGIVCLCRGSTAADEYSSIQWFPVPESGQSRKYGLVCMNVADVGSSGLMGEAQTRVISITNNGSSIRLKSESAGYYYNWGNKGQDNTCAVPAFLYGMKF